MAWVPIATLHKQCSYPMRPDAIAASSDTCRHPADSAVADSEENLWWRCPAHRGQLAAGVAGGIVTRIYTSGQAG